MSFRQTSIPRRIDRSEEAYPLRGTNGVSVRFTYGELEEEDALGLLADRLV